MRGSREFCQKGSSFDNVYFLFFNGVDKKREDPNAIMLADDDLTWNVGLVSL